MSARITAMENSGEIASMILISVAASKIMAHFGVEATEFGIRSVQPQNVRISLAIKVR